MLAMRLSFLVGYYARISMTAPYILCAGYRLQVIWIDAAPMPARWTTGAFRAIMARMVKLMAFRHGADKPEVGRMVSATHRPAQVTVSSTANRSRPFPAAVVKYSNMTQHSYSKRPRFVCLAHALS